MKDKRKDTLIKGKRAIKVSLFNGSLI